MADIYENESLCDKKQRTVVMCDGGKCKYVVHNDDTKEVAEYLIDGQLIKDGLRCDYLFLNVDDKDAYYVELKGSDISHAIEQIKCTEKILYHKVGCNNSFYRIVYRTGTHDVNSANVINWKQSCGILKGKKRAIVKNLVLEEHI